MLLLLDILLLLLLLRLDLDYLAYASVVAVYRQGSWPVPTCRETCEIRRRRFQLEQSWHSWPAPSSSYCSFSSTEAPRRQTSFETSRSIISSGADFLFFFWVHSPPSSSYFPSLLLPFHASSLPRSSPSPQIHLEGFRRRAVCFPARSCVFWLNGVCNMQW